MAKVLVVDDVPDNVKLLSYELADQGYEILTASDGLSAVDLAQSRRPDVILLDVMMPGIDGIEACRRLKADAATAGIPVIMISARDLEEDVVAGLDAGACDYVTKPFNVPIVLARVRSAARAKADRDLIADLNARLAELAATDGLTGLKNSRAFREALTSAGSFASRMDHPLSLILLDVDHFKSYNDTFGHLAGDDVLRTVGTLLRGQLRLHDLAARYGGEEFAVLLPATDDAAAQIVAERLREAIASHPWPLRPITASFGVATLAVGDPASPPDLVAWADRALYASKRAGRNRVTADARLVAGLACG
jgi:diguanylate cyclase (GGDEF)-like protein